MTVTAPGRFSERPGFTLIGGSPTQIGPVVLRVDGSRASFVALRAAVGQAMTRTCGLVVVDTGAAATSEGHPVFDSIDERERTAATGIFRNSHVSRIRTDDPELSEIVDQAEHLRASMLVLSSSDVAMLAGELELLTRVLTGHFDVLMVTTDLAGP